MQRVFSRKFAAMRARACKFGRDEAGSVATFLIAVPVLAGTVAVGVETGEFYSIKRKMQSAADAAAIAGSYDRINGATSSITTDGQYAAQRNGFTNGSNGVTVTINVPPTSGGYTTNTTAVEAIITQTKSFSLGGVIFNWLGKSNNGFTMRARTVAAQGSYTNSSTNTTTTSSTTQEGCIVALTTGNEQGVNITSFNNLNTDCSIMSNGTASTNDSNASIYMSSFNHATLHATTGASAQIWTRGSFYKTSYNSFSADNTLTSQTTTITDPYSSLTIPSSLTCTYTNYAEPSGNNLTLSPGTYCGGLSVVNKSNVYFTPGTYYIANGDLVIRSDNNVSCPNCTNSSGVNFILTQTDGNNSDIGGVSITSENNVSLNAGTGDTYPGVLFYQDRRVANGTMTSSSKIFTLSSLNNVTLSGAVYFPNNRIDIESVNNIDGTSNTGCTIWIGRYIKFASYNNAFKGGCSNYGTTPAGITTTTTATTTTTTTTNLAKVVE